MTTMPDVIMMGATRTEMFGPLDELFPSLKGHMDRTCDDAVALISSIYDRRSCLISPAGHYITHRLARRIIDFAEHDPEIATARNQVVAFQRLRLPIVLLGLRVENRTVVDFTSFCVDLLHIIREEVDGRIVVVIDGHNALRDHVYESAGQSEVQTPIEVERLIAQTLKMRFWMEV